MIEFPWVELGVAFIGLFFVMAAVIVSVRWLHHGSDSVSGGQSDGG